jgi:hypothetical protein
MNNIKKMQALLSKIGLPREQQSDLCAYTLLALSSIENDDSWAEATNSWMGIHEIIAFISHKYGKNYAENTRETFRKMALHYFRTAALVEDNGLATNSPNYKYKITDEFLSVVRSGGNIREINDFLSNHKRLIDLYASKRRFCRIPIKVNGCSLKLSKGRHNLLQKSVIEEFGPRFAPGAECLYVGDTIKRNLVNRKDRLKALGIEISLHDKMPDIVLYRADCDWLYFLECVTSVGPMSPQRIVELRELAQNSSCGKVFVTAFPDFLTYKRFAASLAWETEVWIAEMPDHMIHLNGDKFLGPRS